MVKGDAFTTCLDNASSGLVGEAESSNGEWGDFQKSGIIGNSANNNSSLAFLALALHEAGHTRNRNWWVVNFGHTKSLDDGVSELRISSSGNETKPETEINLWLMPQHKRNTNL